MFTFINNKIEYTVHGVVRTARFGLSMLLETKAGNWIVANGVNVTNEKNFIINEGFATGDWNHGHYYMEDEWKAREYFSFLKENAL